MESTEPPPPPPPAACAPKRPASRRSRWIGSVVAVLVLAALGWWAGHLTHQTPERAAGAPGAAGAGGRGAPPSTVGVAPARRADIPVVIEALGTVVPAANVTVQPQVSGVLTQLLFEEGRIVRKGELLATIAPEPFQMTLTQATGARLRGEAGVDNVVIATGLDLGEPVVTEGGDRLKDGARVQMAVERPAAAAAGAASGARGRRAGHGASAPR